MAYATTKGVEMKLTGAWKAFGMTLSPRRAFAVVSTEVRQATEQNAMHVARAMRRKIKESKYEKNAPLTVALKGSTKPLVHTGQMFAAIKGSMINPTTALAGVLRTAKASDGAELANVAAIVHEGAEINVTPEMRGLFYILHRATTGRLGSQKLGPRAQAIMDARGGGKEIIQPLDPDTEIISIPGRPFVEDTIDRQLVAKLKTNWSRAYQRALSKGLKK